MLLPHLLPPPLPCVQVIRIVPRLNEEVNQEWISDKARFQYDALRYQRLNIPYLKGDKVRLAGGSGGVGWRAAVSYWCCWC